MIHIERLNPEELGYLVAADGTKAHGPGRTTAFFGNRRIATAPDSETILALVRR